MAPVGQTVKNLGVPEGSLDKFPVYQKEADYQNKKNNPKEQSQKLSPGAFFRSSSRSRPALPAVGFSYRHIPMIRGNG
jgi:hypothetical protein